MDAQEREWRAYAAACEAQGRCPHSGLTFSSCKRSDLCDCFDYPDAEVTP